MVKVVKDWSNEEFGLTFQFNFVIGWKIDSNPLTKGLINVVDEGSKESSTNVTHENNVALNDKVYDHKDVHIIIMFVLKLIFSWNPFEEDKESHRVTSGSQGGRPSDLDLGP